MEFTVCYHVDICNQHKNLSPFLRETETDCFGATQHHLLRNTVQEKNIHHWLKFQLYFSCELMLLLRSPFLFFQNIIMVLKKLPKYLAIFNDVTINVSYAWIVVKSEGLVFLLPNVVMNIRKHIILSYLAANHISSLISSNNISSRKLFIKADG